MLSFVLFPEDGVEPWQFPPRHAFLIGPDETPLQSSIALDQSGVKCEKHLPGAAGLALQIVVPRPKVPEQLAKQAPSRAIAGESLGLLTLHTCLLPEHARPYLLTIELARRQVMLVLNKLEDWQLTDLPSDHPVMLQFELARDRFAEALVAQRDETSTAPGAYRKQASQLATQAIALAVEAGEELAIIQAERELRGRITGQTYKAAVERAQSVSPELPSPGQPISLPGVGHVVLPGVPLVGCAISPSAMTEPMQKAALAACDFVTMPMRWIDMEPKEGKYNFATTDRWIEWAVRTAKLPVVAGPVVDFRPQCAPEWLFIWENDYETLRDLVFEHVQAIVTRYRRTVSRWTIASGLHVNTNFKISFEQIMDLTRLCVLLVKKLHPSAKVQIEVSQPWGEYHTSNKRSIPPYLYAEAALAAGIPIDALALRLQMGHAEPGLSTRDLLSFSAMLDRFAALEKPIVLSAIGAPSATQPAKPYVPRAGGEAGDPFEPGYWRMPWSEQVQAEWLSQAMLIAAGKPYIQAICWQELADPANGLMAAEMPSGGVMHATGQPKLALQRLAQIRSLLREGRLPPVPAPSTSPR